MDRNVIKWLLGGLLIVALISACGPGDEVTMDEDELVTEAFVDQSDADGSPSAEDPESAPMEVTRIQDTAELESGVDEVSAEEVTAESEAGEDSTVEASVEFWPFIYTCTDELPVDFSAIDLSELENMDINSIEIGYDPETNEIFYDVGFNRAEAQQILMGLDFAGQDLPQKPTETPLVLSGGFHATFGVAFQNGEPVADIQGIFSGNEMVLTESEVTGAIVDNHGLSRLPLNVIPFGADSVRGVISDGTFCAPLQSLDENNGFLPLADLLDPDTMRMLEDELREYFCSNATNTCFGLRPEWNGVANGNIIGSIIDDVETTWIHGVNTQSSVERWQVFLSEGWDDTGPPEQYQGKLHDWVIYKLSSEGITQGFVAFSEVDGFTYELSLQIPGGVTEAVSEEQFLRTVDTFLGPRSQ